MTVYEIASLLNELLTTLLAVVETFMAALFAMLATAYFVAPRLTRTMSATIIGLFTLFSTLTIFFAFAASRRVATFGVQLDEMGAEMGADLSWIFFVPTAAPIVPATIAIILIVAYAAAISFFLQARRQDRAAGR